MTPKTAAFLAGLDALCKKYNRSISHEDSQGSFIIEPYDEGNLEWLKEAFESDRTLEDSEDA